jgi:hypothetical protein
MYKAESTQGMDRNPARIIPILPEFLHSSRNQWRGGKYWNMYILDSYLNFNKGIYNGSDVALYVVIHRGGGSSPIWKLQQVLVTSRS